MHKRARPNEVSVCVHRHRSFSSPSAAEASSLHIPSSRLSDNQVLSSLSGREPCPTNLLLSHQRRATYRGNLQARRHGKLCRQVTLRKLLPSQFRAGARGTKRCRQFCREHYVACLPCRCTWYWHWNEKYLKMWIECRYEKRTLHLLTWDLATRNHRDLELKEIYFNFPSLLWFDRYLWKCECVERLVIFECSIWKCCVSC